MWGQQFQVNAKAKTVFVSENTPIRQTAGKKKNHISKLSTEHVIRSRTFNYMSLCVAQAGTFVTSQPGRKGWQQPMACSMHEMLTCSSRAKIRAWAGSDPALLSANHWTQHLLMAQRGCVGASRLVLSHMLVDIWLVNNTSNVFDVSCDLNCMPGEGLQ